VDLRVAVVEESVRWLWCRIEALPEDSALQRVLQDEAKRPTETADARTIFSVLSGARMN